MDGALVSDLHQLRLLLGVERPGDFYFPLDAIDHTLFGLTIGAILGVNLQMAQPDLNRFERPALVPRIQLESHRRAGPQARQQQIVRRGADIGPSGRYWLIGLQAMYADENVLNQAARPPRDDHVALFLSSHIVSHGVLGQVSETF